MDKGPAHSVSIGRYDVSNSDLKSYEISFKIEDNRDLDHFLLQHLTVFDSIHQTFKKILMQSFSILVMYSTVGVGNDCNTWMIFDRIRLFNIHTLPMGVMLQYTQRCISFFILSILFSIFWIVMF